ARIAADVRAAGRAVAVVPVRGDGVVRDGTVQRLVRDALLFGIVGLARRRRRAAARAAGPGRAAGSAGAAVASRAGIAAAASPQSILAVGLAGTAALRVT